MNNLRAPLTVSAVVVLAVLVAIVTNVRQAVAQNPNPGSAPVNIVSPVPLPVTGNVGISGTPTINFSNTSSTPLFVQDVAATPVPYMASLSADFSTATHVADQEIDFPAVPSGKRLVVTQYDSILRVSGATPFDVDVLVRGAVFPNFLAFPKYTPTFGTVSIASQPLLVYFDEGTQPAVQFDVFPPGKMSATVTLSGYLINCGAGCPAVAP